MKKHQLKGGKLISGVPTMKKLLHYFFGKFRNMLKIALPINREVGTLEISFYHQI